MDARRGMDHGPVLLPTVRAKPRFGTPQEYHAPSIPSASPAMSLGRPGTSSVLPRVRPGPQQLALRRRRRMEQSPHLVPADRHERAGGIWALGASVTAAPLLSWAGAGWMCDLLAC